MNCDLDLLQPYPFEKLSALKDAIVPPSCLQHIALSIGEPKHQPPQFVLDCLIDNLASVANYPSTKGIPELRGAIAKWASKRFGLNTELNPDTQALPVAGTREALYSFTQACVSASSTARVVMPNPFYQIYEGAALLAGAKPYFLNCSPQNNYCPDFGSVPEHIWQDCQLLFICTPGNPTGSVLSIAQLQQLISLADQHDFTIASDECYSELYFDETRPPPGLLQACAEMGRDNYSRCVVFHSLSKRSNLPGLRSGFVAGDANILKKYLLFRTYEGCALPIPTQMASIAAWNNDAHVRENRTLYRAKFEAVLGILEGCLAVQKPDAGFYLWAKTPIDDTHFAQQLFAQQNVTVLPGQYLARDTSQGNPGKHHIRMALVATLEECIDAANRIKHFVQTLEA